MPTILKGTKFFGSVSVSGSLTLSGSLESTVASASFATTASYVTPTFPYNGNAQVSGSLTVTGSVSVTGSLIIKSSDVTTSVVNPLLYIETNNGTNKITAIDGIYKNGNRPEIVASSKLGTLNLTDLGTVATDGNSKGLVLPTAAPVDPVNGSVYWVQAQNRLLIYNGSTWKTSSFG